jgi:dTDP-glucose 4,6-dehydratase
VPNFKVPLITGGAGFIGSEMVRQLVADDSIEKIYVLDKLTYAGNLRRIAKEIESGKIEIIESDLNLSVNYEKYLLDVDAVFHFAAETHVDRSILSGKSFYESNVLGTYHLLDSIRANGNARTVIVSTDEVYGSIEEGEFTEKDAIDASSPYSASKAAAELVGLAQWKTYGQDVVITRCSNNFGLFQDKEKFIPTVINSVKNDLHIPIYGSGRNVREWIHISDHVRALITIFDEADSGEILNIGSGERFTNLEIARIILGLMPNSKSQIEYITDRLGHDFRYAVNTDRLRGKYSWSPTVKLEAGLLELVSSEIDF